MYHIRGAQSIYKEHGILEEAIQLAQEAAAALVSKMDALKKYCLKLLTAKTK